MDYGFWKGLREHVPKKPILALAPMANVTDAAFRRIIAKYGKPDVMWTEFVSCDGLCSEGREKLLIDLEYHESERPIVAQFFGATPENFCECAKLARELGFDGIDINMGCPDRNVEKQGAGAALIKNPCLATEIIRATKEGAEDIPVSVKTRIGYHTNSITEWLPHILAAEPAAVIIHARTRAEMSRVPAQWDVVRDAVQYIDAEYADSRPVILGNGDVKNIKDAEEKIALSHADGVMIGRAIFGNPWLFHAHVNYEDIAPREKLRVMLEHTLLFEELFQGKKHFDIMKKHYKAYVQGFNGAKELRIKLMECTNASQVARVVQGAYGNV